MPSQKTVEGLVGAHLSKTQFKALDDSLDMYARAVFRAARRIALKRAGNAQAAKITAADMREVATTVLRLRKI